MKVAIRQRALELGFDDCRITSAAAPASAEVYQRWLAARQHGEMGYLERNASKRVDPQLVLPGARSVIVLAASYHLGTRSDSLSSPKGGEGRGEEAVTLKEPEAPSPLPSRPLGGEGDRAGYDAIQGLAAASVVAKRDFETEREAPHPALSPSDGERVAEGRVRGFSEITSGKQYKPITGIIARYARFADYHDVLGERLRQLTDFINATGGPEVRSLWYVDTGPILERDLAQRAGLGFVGKHTNVISRKLGNWIFLAEILTTLELEADTPEKNRCGSCTRCIESCPTRAITAPFQLDARLCISYLTIELKGSIPVDLRPAIGNRIYGCDDCLAACPWNRFAQEGKLMKTHGRPELSTPDLLPLLELDDAGFKAKFTGTPILRTKRRGFLRNVCVALGNSGDQRVLPALQRAATDAEPLIREHAQWAIEQLTQKQV